MQSERGFPSSHQLKCYIASKSRLKLAARCPVSGCWPSCNACDSHRLCSRTSKLRGGSRGSFGLDDPRAFHQCI